jgi:hypothetical protein
LMGPRRNHFITKVAEEPGKVAVKRPGEIRTKPTPAVAQYGKRALRHEAWGGALLRVI